MIKESHSYRPKVILMFIMAAAAMLPGIGLAPLFLEEPRRAIVAMEMVFNNDLIHTTIHGQAYYNKPPLFNWIILAGFKLFGYHEWILRTITVVSHLGIGWMVYRMGRRFFSEHAGLLAAGFYLTGADILFYFSLIGEIDVFFSLLIVSGWFSYYYFTVQKKQAFAFGMFYLFMALGFLTKGLPAVLFAAFTIVFWHWFKGSFANLFSRDHILGLIPGLVILMVYFIPFVAKGDFQTLLSTLWGQSIERAEAPSFSGRVVSFFTFPLKLLKDVVPAAFLLLTFRFSSFKEFLRKHDFFAFCFLVFAANIWVYWISPDSQSRYHYMFHPLIILPLVYQYLRFEGKTSFKTFIHKLFIVLSWFFLLVLAAGIIAVPLALPTKGISWIVPVVFPVAVAAIWLQKRYSWSPLFLVIILLLLLRLPYGLITHLERSQNSQASKDKGVAIEMARIIGTSPVYLWDKTRISTTISYYLQRDLERTVPYSNTLNSGSFYILADSVLQTGMAIRTKFTYQRNHFSLVEVR